MSKWIWYHGDFEIYHAMKQNFDREERGMTWPAYWYTSNWNHNVYFKRDYEVTHKQTFIVHAKGKGYVKITNLGSDEHESKFPLDTKIESPIGHIRIQVFVSNMQGLPTVLVEGNQIFSDEEWVASNFLGSDVSVGTSKYFTHANQNPMKFEYSQRRLMASKIEIIDGGTLYDFGHDITAQTLFKFNNNFQQITLSYGESRTEALDVLGTYLKHTLKKEKDPLGQYYPETKTFVTKLRAFRYIYVPDVSNLKKIGQLSVNFEYVDFPQIGNFKSSDNELSQIWKIADRTLRLCSGVFFIDGVKRDRWVWAGDAYQCYFMNRYDFFDKEIVERTILGLRGELDIKQHLDTIVDYSLYWLISIELYYETFADKNFVNNIYQKMKRLMDYSLEQTNDLGFIYGRKGDWIYIDWADIDRNGTLCAEQMLLARALQSMVYISKLLGKDDTFYQKKYHDLRQNIDHYFWNATKHAYIDSYESGMKHVSRHANIFAILFGYVGQNRANEIVRSVLRNDRIEPIKTPYFKFWELEALAQIGKYKYVLDEIKSYWGGMLANGATTFWEQFDPTKQGSARYEMYDDKYGKSLCHAWGSSPIYLIGRYLVGLRPTAPGYGTYEINPQLKLLNDFDCTFPLSTSGDKVEMSVHEGTLNITATRPGGVLKLSDRKMTIPANETIELSINENNNWKVKK
ncbi:MULTISPECIES: amylo-alpha-1,6-glucosidase [Lactiplantibacillus]|uniref:Alpha-rhamnosidase n=5 Tax=Lactiplantibacillus pentosus TaxID=1589 RepID=A0AAX6LB33_LACPE|nr:MULTISPECIES: amylo-alpha-1,6-glucosidase [Lactiplantibacillus]MCM8608540.1 family 78 glycoside hydrolase catalytic domain [Lactiplantibacillus sp. B652]MCT3297099.1 alpha-rhamnosidase [Lactiplantibacillus pentosus]MDF2311722.1 family 78 glycoside hydrolase catalytic domain [Lactiplantibacillus pentosus]PRO94307.1 alpha-rhamnosidase [Lactiplantibacillus pentosus]